MIARMVPHKTAPKKGQRIHANASDMTTTSSRNVLSSRPGKLAELGDFIICKNWVSVLSLRLAWHGWSRVKTKLEIALSQALAPVEHGLGLGSSPSRDKWSVPGSIPLIYSTNIHRKKTRLVKRDQGCAKRKARVGSAPGKLRRHADRCANPAGIWTLPRRSSTPAIKLL